MRKPNLNKRDLLKLVGQLYDTGNVVFTLSNPKKKYKAGEAPSERMQAVVDLIKTLIARQIRPFNKDIISTQEAIEKVVDLKFCTPQMVGKCFRLIGMRQIGQVMNKEGKPTRVWIVRDFAKYSKMSLKQISESRNEQV